MEKLQNILLLMSAFILLITGCSSGAWVVREDAKVYIEDRNGERWDVTEAEQLGFVPQRFQYGIGKVTFTPLDDGNFTDDRPVSSSDTRIIGIAFEGDAHAYVVNRLKRHEIANTTIAGKAIAAGY